MTDINRYRQDTYADEWVIRSDETGLPIDITECSFVLTVSSQQNPTSETGQLFQIVGTIINGSAGRVEFAPDSEDVETVGVFYYDLQMTDGNDRIRTIDKGKYTITQDITKSVD
jgi:hypothetical protein